MAGESSLPTIGEIARRGGVPLHRVEYVIRSRELRPVATTGNARVYSEATADLILAELRRIEGARQGSGPPKLATTYEATSPSTRTASGMFPSVAGDGVDFTLTNPADFLREFAAWGSLGPKFADGLSKLGISGGRGLAGAVEFDDILNRLLGPPGFDDAIRELALDGPRPVSDPTTATVEAATI